MSDVNQPGASELVRSSATLFGMGEMRRFPKPFGAMQRVMGSTELGNSRGDSASGVRPRRTYRPQARHLTVSRHGMLWQAWRRSRMACRNMLLFYRAWPVG